MPLLDIPVPNLLGGVSQQPPSQRTPGQVESCDNALLHVVNGLAKRKGTRHLGRLITGLESVRLVHLIDRDPTERYVILAGERRLRVFSADDGTEFPVRLNGAATVAGRGQDSSGTPILYLDPRTPGGVLDQDEDFVIGAGDWLTDSGNVSTAYLSGRGPFRFGRRQSTSAVTADTVADVGNDAAATVGDIHQAFGVFSAHNLFSVYVKKGASAINDVELTLHSPGAPDTVAGARFDIDSGGVVTFGAIVSTSVSPDDQVQATVEVIRDGWYRCSVQVRAVPGLPAVGEIGDGGTRETWIRFHTNAATPASKRCLLFGARCYDTERASTPIPDYVFPQPDLFRALTISDTTLLLNTEIVAAMTADQAADNLGTGIIWVRQGGIDDVRYNYTVKRTDGASFTSFTLTAGAGALQTDEDIAADITTQINADANFNATRRGSVVRVTAAAGEVIAVEVSDSRDSSFMVGFVDVITRFTDLPLVCDVAGSAPTNRHTVKVTGNPERDADDYYVQFEGDPDATSSGNLTRGIWAESLARPRRSADNGILTTIDGATMPLKVRRLQDDAAGTKTGVPNAIFFDVSPVTWDQRLVGDDESNPQPSFIGHAIRDLFLHRGRLGFLASDNVIMSEAGEVFNFWRTTVLDLVDTDPIDVSTGAKEAVDFRNAAVTADSLLLFSERRQYQLLGEPVLTPATAQLAVVRSFSSLGQCRPIDSGRGVSFARSDDTFSGLMEASLLQDDVTFRFEDLTVQAPHYIAGRALELVYSSLTELIVASSEDAGNRLFVHQSFHDDQENRLQSAVHRWVLDDDAQVRGMGFLGPDLRLVTERGQGWFLESVLTDAETSEGGRPITHLDRRLTAAQVTLAYAGGPDETTITLPFDISPTAEVEVVDAAAGLIIPIVSQTTTAVVVRGDVTASALFVGEAYDLEVELTEAVIQDQSPRGGVVPRMGRPINVNRLYLYVADTAFLEVEVAPDLRTPSVEEFSAAGLGTGLLLEGELNLFTGVADFAIIGLSTELDVTIRNPTPFPSYVESGRWEVVHRQRAGIA